MSVHVMSWVLRNSQARLGDRLVLLVLADHAGDDGTGAWPSVATIAREAHLSEKQVQRCLGSLRRADRIVASGKSKAGTTIYDVLMNEGGDNMSGATERPSGGATSRPSGGDRMSPEPSLDQPSEDQPGTLPAAPEYDPVKGARIDGQDLVWDALAAETNATDAIHASRMKRSVTSIRRQTVAWLAAEKPGAVERAQTDPEGFERALAETVRVVVGRMKRRSPDLTWGPEGIARNFGAHLSEASGGNVQSIVADVLRGAA